MRNHINKYIFTEFKLKEAEKANPFYVCIKKSLSSLVYLEIAEDYRKRNWNEYSQSLAFLNRFNLYFIEGRNEIEFYHKVQNITQSIFSSMFSSVFKGKDYREDKDPDFVINSYIK